MLYSAVAETGEEVFGLLVLGIGEEGCGSALLEDDAFVHEDDTAADVPGEGHLVRLSLIHI